MALFSSTPKELDIHKLQLENESRLGQLSPLVKQIHSNAALHFIGKGMDYMIEFSLYLLGLACFVFLFIMDTIFPFHILGEIVSKQVFRQAITNSGDLDTFQLAVKGLVGLIGILIISMGLMKNSSRRRKEILQHAGKVLKSNEQYFLDLKTKFDKELPKSVSTEDHLSKIEPKPFPENLA